VKTKGVKTLKLSTLTSTEKDGATTG